MHTITLSPFKYSQMDEEVPTVLSRLSIKPSQEKLQVFEGTVNTLKPNCQTSEVKF